MKKIIADMKESLEKSLPFILVLIVCLYAIVIRTVFKPNGITGSTVVFSTGFFLMMGIMLIGTLWISPRGEKKQAFLYCFKVSPLIALFAGLAVLISFSSH